MQASRRLGLLVMVCTGIVGCSGGVTATEATRIPATGRSDDQLEPAPRPSGVKPQGTLVFVDQVMALAKAHGEVIAIGSSGREPEVAIAATFTPVSEAHPAQCGVAIYEVRDGAVIEAGFSDALLSCELEASADQAGRRVDIAFEGARILVRQVFAKSNARFGIERDRSGTWRVTEAEFSAPQHDAGTDALRVLVERVVYSNPEDGLPVDGYSYDKLQPDLVQEYVD